MRRMPPARNLWFRIFRRFQPCTDVIDTSLMKRSYHSGEILFSFSPSKSITEIWRAFWEWKWFGKPSALSKPRGPLPQGCCCASDTAFLWGFSRARTSCFQSLVSALTAPGQSAPGCNGHLPGTGGLGREDTAVNSGPGSWQWAVGRGNQTVSG